jgi:hypothetical protein
MSKKKYTGDFEKNHNGYAHDDPDLKRFVGSYGYLPWVAKDITLPEAEQVWFDIEKVKYDADCIYKPKHPCPF